MPPIVREATLADRDALRSLAIDSGLFGPDDSTLLTDAFDHDHRGPDSPDGIWLLIGESEAQGAAYCSPEPDGDRVWNVLFLAVRPADQHQGLATELLRQTEQAVVRRGGRLLLIETSDADEQAAARRLYAHVGFTQIATIPDFYGEGEAKVIFSRAIAGNNTEHDA